MARTFYTLWKCKDGDYDEALFLQEQPIFRTKHRALKRAHKLAKGLVDGWGFTILLRKIRTDTDICEQWEFKPE